MKPCLAIDIGASGGRHIVGYTENGELKTRQIYRFPNGQKRCDGHLIWDMEQMFGEVLEGIRRTFAEYPDLASISVDTWGVDYVLMRGEEEVLPVYAYRDSRTGEVIEQVHGIIPFAELYRRTGIQFAAFNTLYQLYADKKAGRLAGVTDFLMIPDYLMYRLTGVKRKEYTNATTTGMINAKTRSFDTEIVRRLGLPEGMFGELSMPGTFVGELKKEVQEAVGGNAPVVLCATHDTASAVEAIDMGHNAPYISSGTWSLLGIKTAEAITTDESRETNYSNEGGVGYNRYQKNITGMWIVQSLRGELCPDKEYDDIAEEARAGSFSGLFDVNHPCFSAPASMKEAIDGWFASRGEEKPGSTADYFRAAYRSLADGYRLAFADLERVTGIRFEEVYIVGGGAKNRYLNEITEQMTGVRVRALPIEATSIGNLKVQMKAHKE